ncbi:MAG: CinA family protein [Magnetococcales bacterium]|nr:CinA family protein [Magnetococcales bacterium]
MMCLQVVPRWGGGDGLAAVSGRPHLDLFLHCLGYEDVHLLEVDPEDPLDPNQLNERYGLVLVQGEAGSRLRRSVISNLGLSLGLDGNDSSELRVVGARPLTDRQGQRAGFAVRRRGRIVAFCERPVWELRHTLVACIRAFMREDEPELRPRRMPVYWMVEGSEPLFDKQDGQGEEGCKHCKTRLLPDGDSALWLPAVLSENVKKMLEQQLGKRLFATEPNTLEEVLADLLLRTRLRVAVAESCTAGLIAARLTSLPGSSQWFSHGLVTYSNDSKQRLLDGVGPLLERCGAVSQETALAMARATLRVAESDLAIAVTGIAGPEGGTPEKPVGTVYLAAVARDGGIIERCHHFPGDRARVRLQTSQTALHLLRRLAMERV